MKFVFIALFISLASHATVQETLNETVSFFDWLAKHQKEFAQCSPKKVGDNFELCDQTLVPVKKVKELFSSSPQAVLLDIKKKGLKTEILCDKEKGDYTDSCVVSTTNTMFNQISSLHGKYVPESRTVYLKSSTSKGSVIHEYIYSLQSDNKRPVFGKVYKQERNRLHKALTDIMDEKIRIIKELEEAKKDKSAMESHLKEFLLASQLMKYFADWQDLIDERSIFLLYLNFGKELGVPSPDLELARINMKYICKNPKLKNLLPKEQCPYPL